MTKQLSVRSEEAYRLAHAIADQTGRTLGDVLTLALRSYASTLPAVDGMTPRQRAAYEYFRALGRRSALRKKPGATSDHGDMYDEYGLPI